MHAVYFYRHTCTGNESESGCPKTEHTCTCIFSFGCQVPILPCAFQDGVKNIKLLTDDKRQKVTRVTQGLKNYVFTAIFVTLPLKKINK